MDLYKLPKELLVKIILNQAENASQYAEPEECNKQIDNYIKRLIELSNLYRKKLNDILFSITGSEIYYFDSDSYIDFYYDNYYIRMELNSKEVFYVSAGAEDDDCLDLSQETIFIMFPQIKLYWMEMNKTENKRLFSEYSKISKYLMGIKYKLK
jgi:hypothetical protein